MKKLLLRLANGREDEWDKIALLLSIGFFSGTLIATYDVTVTTLFTGVFNEKRDLPFAFFTSGLIGVIFTYIYARYQKKHGFLRTAVYSSLLIMLVIVLFTLLLNIYYVAEGEGIAYNESLNAALAQLKRLQVPEHPEFAIYASLVFLTFAAMVSINAVTVLIFWGIFGRIFTVRAAKRLSGGIDTGQAVSTILAFFTVPFIRDIFGSSAHLLYISLASSVVFFVLIVYLFRNFKLQNIRGSRVSKTAIMRSVMSNKIQQSLQNKYVRLISVFVICSALAAAFVEYSFLTVVDQQFPDEGARLKFLAFFEGFTMVLAFLVQTFFNDFFIERYGLKLALLLLPFVLLVFTILSTVVGHSVGYTTEIGGLFVFFFLLIAFNNLITDALRDSLENPTVKIFFFPLNSRIRFDLQTSIEGPIRESANLFGGLLMIILTTVGAAYYNVLYNNYVLFIIISLWMYITHLMYKGYRENLTTSLSNTRVSHREKRNERSSESVVSLLSQELEREDYRRIILTMRLAEQLDPIFYRSSLSSFSSYEHANALDFSLKEIENKQVFEAKRPLRTYKRSIKGADGVEQAKAILDRLNTLEKYFSTDEQLAELSSSTNVEHRLLAARLINYNPTEKNAEYLLPLFRDFSREIRVAAIVATGRNNLSRYLPIIIEYLNQSGYENAAFAALINFGEEAIAYLDTAFYKNGQSVHTKELIIRIFGRIAGEKSVQVLVSKLNYPDQHLVYEVYHALHLHGWQAGEKEKTYLKMALIAQAGDMIWNIAALEAVKNDEQNRMLRESLNQQIQVNYENLFLLLSLMYDRENIRLVRNSLNSGTADGIGYALELLDVFLDEDLKNKIIPLIDEISNIEKIKKLEVQFPFEMSNSENILLKLVNRDYNAINKWTKACALSSYADSRKGAVLDDYVAHLFNPDKMLREIAAEIIYKLNPEAYEKYCQRLPAEHVKELNRVVHMSTSTQINAVPSAALLFDKVILFMEAPLFYNLPGIKITNILIGMTERWYRKDEVVIPQNELAHTDTIFVATGSVAITKNEVIHAIAEEGDVISEIFNTLPGLKDDLSGYEFITNENSVLYYLEPNQLFRTLAHDTQIIRQILYNYELILRQQYLNAA